MRVPEDVAGALQKQAARLAREERHFLGLGRLLLNPRVLVLVFVDATTRARRRTGGRAQAAQRLAAPREMQPTRLLMA